MLRQISTRFLSTSRKLKTEKFAQFLKAEIQEEDDREDQPALDLSPFQDNGWKVDVTGPHIELKKTIDNAKFTVNWSVNGSVGDMNEHEDEQTPLSLPTFSIRSEKEKCKNLIQWECGFVENQEEEMEQEEGAAQQFFIHGVTLFDKKNIDEKTKAPAKETYFIGTDNIDQNTYAHFDEYLKDCGFDQTFTDELIELSTAVENNNYMETLSGMEEFMKC